MQAHAEVRFSNYLGELRRKHAHDVMRAVRQNGTDLSIAQLLQVDDLRVKAKAYGKKCTKVSRGNHGDIAHFEISKLLSN